MELRPRACDGGTLTHFVAWSPQVSGADPFDRDVFPPDDVVQAFRSIATVVVDDVVSVGNRSDLTIEMLSPRWAAI